MTDGGLDPVGWPQNSPVGWPQSSPVGWPQSLWFVRHGESLGNVARARAYAAGDESIDSDCYDSEVALSPRGIEQAASLGSSIAQLAPELRPTLVVASSYLRARQTAQTILAAAELEIPTRVDERLRDREQGILDCLTGLGILARYPDEARRRAYVGKFGYRPPGGESWADVALRLRSALLDIRLDASGERVLVVCHDVVVILSRLILAGINIEAAVRLSGEVANCGLTRYVRDQQGSGMVLDTWNDVTHLQERNTPITRRS